jgi:hypothetical protein
MGLPVYLIFNRYTLAAYFFKPPAFREAFYYLDPGKAGLVLLTVKQSSEFKMSKFGFKKSS